MNALPHTDPPYDIRAGAAGALLACHLLRCVRAHAAGKPMPEMDLDGLEGPKDLENGFMFATAALGINPDDERRRIPVERFLTAIAEMIADQGAQLEVELAGLIHGECRRAVVYILEEVKADEVEGDDEP